MPLLPPAPLTGLVVKSTGSWYVVRTTGADGAPCLWRARLRGKFRTANLRVSNPVAVGDEVTLLPEDAADATAPAVITQIGPRRNYIIRRSVHRAGQRQIVAANLDQALLLVTLVSPATSLGFIDRFVVTAQAYAIPVVLVFNKADEYSPEMAAVQQELADLYAPLGYASLVCSAHTGAGLEAVRAKLAGRRSLLSGHSGVGKSTLVNALIPGLDVQTAEISAFSDKGVHTTTVAELYAVDGTTDLIDTPGIKELGVVDISGAELAHFFPEMAVRLGHCRYHNCRHTHEPGCAVRAAVEADEIAASRYDSYLSILTDDDNRR